jgi:hypothetical protein
LIHVKICIRSYQNFFKPMKTIILFAATICLGLIALPMMAQPWSEVGEPGFTTNALTNSAITYAHDYASYSTTKYAVYITSAGPLEVMQNTSGTWTTMPSPNTGTGTFAFYPSLAVDATGVPYIAYAAGASNERMTVKKFNGTSWVLVGTAGFTPLGSAYATQIVFDPTTNTPYVCYYRHGGSNRVNVMKFDGTAWVVVGASDFTSTTTHVRMAITSTGVPYVAYVDSGISNKVSVQKFNGTAWVQVGTAGFSNVTNIALVDIALDAAGVPYVVYSTTNTGNKVNVMKFDGTNWVQVGAADFTPGAANHPRIKINSAGVPHIVFQDGANGNRCSVMKFNGTNWISVGDAGFSGGVAAFPNLLFDASGIPNVAYKDGLYSNRGSWMKLCGSSTATISSTTPGSVCGAGIVSLSATSAGTIHWYNAAANGTLVATGPTYTTPSLSATTTYYVSAYDASGCTSARTAIIATVKPLPTITTTTPGNVCDTGTVSLSATPSAGIINWYASLTGGAILGTGTTFNTPSLTNTTTYYAEAVNAGCSSLSRTAVVANVNTTPASPTPVHGSRCGNGTVTLGATSGAGTVTWFTASTGGTFIGTGATFTTPNISISTTYYAQVTSAAGCISARAAVLATINAIPTITSSANGTRCGAGSVTVTATPSVGTIAWYDQSTGGTLLGTGNTLTTPSLTSGTNFYAEATNNGCKSVSRTIVLGVIIPIPDAQSSNVARCDAGSVTFTALSNGTVSWYAAASGGSALATGLSFTTPTLNNTTNYYLEATANGCTSSPRTLVVATINATPVISSAPAAERCGAGDVPLTATSSAGAIDWFDVAAGGVTLGSGSITVTASSSINYFVEASSNGCTSARTMVPVTVKPLPTLSVTSASRCDAGTLTLSAASDGTIDWYDQASGGTSLTTGSSFITPSLNSNTTYFAESVLNGCANTTRTPVVATVTILPQPVISANNSNPSAPVLTSSSATGNQWYKNEVAISGATNNTFTVSEAGSYKVQVTSNGCVSVFSTPLPYIVTALEPSLVSSVNIYPNPVSDQLILNLAGFDKNQAVNVAVIDLAGRHVFATESMGGKQVQVDVRTYTTGQYFISMSQGQRRIIKSFIKIL